MGQRERERERETAGMQDYWKGLNAGGGCGNRTYFPMSRSYSAVSAYILGSLVPCIKNPSRDVMAFDVVFAPNISTERGGKGFRIQWRV